MSEKPTKTKRLNLGLLGFFLLLLGAWLLKPFLLGIFLLFDPTKMLCTCSGGFVDGGIQALETFYRLITEAFIPAVSITGWGIFFTSIFLITWGIAIMTFALNGDKSIFGLKGENHENIN